MTKFHEDYRVKIRALRLLSRLGYSYLSPRLLPLLVNGQVRVA
ncbi:MAG: hypothetical protein ABIO84_00730 [Lysobacter sp.]